nr:immunoglobulin heavy chain junction region [Macaca mulatta]MOV89138.1 immunoglobulin heavy chain junction region [Macaca mulatta]
CARDSGVGTTRDGNFDYW